MKARAFSLGAGRAEVVDDRPAQGELDDRLTRRVPMRLESETVRRIAECFAGRPCCRCGHPAARLVRGRFYCEYHFPRGKAGGQVPKFYRCQVG
jgi:hypothetical protein